MHQHWNPKPSMGRRRRKASFWHLDQRRHFVSSRGLYHRPSLVALSMTRLSLSAGSRTDSSTSSRIPTLDVLDAVEESGTRRYAVRLEQVSLRRFLLQSLVDAAFSTYGTAPGLHRTERAVRPQIQYSTHISSLDSNEFPVSSLREMDGKQTHTHTHTHTHLHTYTHVCVYIYIYIYIYLHTCICLSLYSKWNS